MSETKLPELPESAGRVIDRTEWRGVQIAACEKAVYVYHEGAWRRIEAGPYRGV